jgi:uncharacterized protein YkwD
MIPGTTKLFVAAAMLAGAAACTTSAPTKPSQTPESTAAPQQVTLAISLQPQNQTIDSGSYATLSVGGAGTGTLSYQWYVGASGATSAPVGGGTASTFTTPALSATTSYWVRVTDTTGSIDSTTATITVTTAAPTPTPTPTPAPTPTPTPTPTPPAVIAPTITVQPESQTIPSGHTAQLSVQESGTTPFSYQWYSGVSGVTSSPMSGAVGQMFTTPTLTATTSYWVRVSNAAGSADSATATITVTPPPPAGVAPAIVAQPANQTISSGQVATLSIAASGTAPLSYQWYIGTTSVTSSPVSGAIGSMFTTLALSATTTYWVRVNNGFGIADSVTATIAVAVDPGNPAFEDQVLTLVNQQRAAGAVCGGTPYPAVGPLTMDANLRLAARNHSQDMATNNYFSHTSLDGRTFDQRIHNAGYTGSFPLGENIAAGQPTPQSVVDAWMASPGHCTNIMTGGFHAVGVGYAFAAASTYRFYWTMDFGGG